MSGSVASPFRQPKAVFAVAFACVVSFMGIGLVDPILPAISHQLHASPSEVTLLFTSYLVVTAVAMLITNWVSSRLGAKKTLIAGLIMIVVFSAAAGASPSINAIVGFRAGWGVGNALFIATSLAVIVASASGGFAGAIVLYETALGVGIAIGPQDQGALAAALPAIDALTSTQRNGGMLAAGSPGALTAAQVPTKPHVRKRALDE